MTLRRTGKPPGGQLPQRRHISEVVADWFTALLLVLAALASFWGGFVDDANQIKYLSVAVGLIATEIIVERVVLSRKLLSFVRDGERSLHDIEARTNSTHDIMQRVVMPHFERDGNNPVFHRLKLSWNDRAKSRDDGKTIEVSRHDSLDLWQDCLLKSSTWDALSCAPDLWLPHELRISDLTQQLHTSTTGSIRRVFVVDSDSELDVMMPIIREQSGRFRVRWIHRERLEQLRDHQQHGTAAQEPWLSDLDFAVADNSFVLEFVLGGKQLQGSRLTVKPEVVQAARRLFDLAFNEGEEVSLAVMQVG